LFDTSVRTDFLFAISQKAKIDPYTGLFIRSTLMDEIRRTAFDEWLKNPESVRLGNFEILALDMENFKIGNELLGHDGFDELIEQMAHGFISMSQYLSANERSSQPYPADDGGKQYAGAMEHYFPPRSEERHLLNMAKKRGILIEFYRDRSGADEALIYVKYTKEKSEANQRIAQELVDSIFYKTELPRHDRKAQRELDEIARNTIPNKLQINSKERDAMMRIIRDEGNISTEEFTDEELYGYVQYLNSIAGYVRGLVNVTSISSHPELHLHMGATFAAGNMDEAMSNFLFGMNPDGTITEGEGLLTLTGQLNMKAYQQYLDGISSNTQLIADAVGFADLPLIEDVTRSEAMAPISGRLISTLFHRVEERKKHTKNQSLIDALKGDNTKLYQIAASEKAGRMVGDKTLGDEEEIGGDIDVRDHLAILLVLERHYRSIYELRQLGLGPETDTQGKNLYSEEANSWEARFGKRSGGMDRTNQMIFEEITKAKGQEIYDRIAKGYR
jgi:hypothetical protein